MGQEVRKPRFFIPLTSLFPPLRLAPLTQFLPQKPAPLSTCMYLRQETLFEISKFRQECPNLTFSICPLAPASPVPTPSPSVVRVRVLPTAHLKFLPILVPRAGAGRMGQIVIQTCREFHHGFDVRF